MKKTELMKNEVLTQDEKLVADFIKTRTKKVLADIQALSEMKVQDLNAWSESFIYLARTYGRGSDETFKWYKYYFREHLIPDAVALPLLVQVYFDGQVDNGFVNTFVKAVACEPAEIKAGRMEEMKKNLTEFMDEDGKIILYRGSFKKPFGSENDSSRAIERAFTFTLDKEIARQYACGWFPEEAKIYTVKANLEDIAWYNLYDEEKTVLMIPQSKGGMWQVVEETDVPASEFGTEAERRAARQVYNASFK
jgi:hypothetical protein